jgi:hypothetical protein
LVWDQEVESSNLSAPILFIVEKGVFDRRPIVGKSFRIEGARVGRRWTNLERWQAWWQNEGSCDPKYR